MLVGRIVYIQDRLVGGEGEAVRQGEVLHQPVEGPVRGDAVYAIARLLFSWDGLGPPIRGPRHTWGARLDGVGRVGEVYRAVRLHHDVVGAVEPLAFEPLSQNRAGAVVRDAGHATAAVLRRQNPALAVQGQAIGVPRGVGRQLRALRQAAPAHDTLVGNIAEEQGGPTPHRPFR